MGVVFSPDLVQGIADAVEIKNMKHGKKDAAAHNKIMEKTQVYRKGELIK